MLHRKHRLLIMHIRMLKELTVVDFMEQCRLKEHRLTKAVPQFARPGAVHTLADSYLPKALLVMQKLRSERDTWNFL